MLDQKRVAEIYLEKSGLDFTIVRPGGLEVAASAELGPLIVSGPDTLLGLDSDAGRVISRDTVAEVCIQVLVRCAAALCHSSRTLPVGTASGVCVFVRGSGMSVRDWLGAGACLFCAQVDSDSKNRIVEVVTANDKSRKPIPREDWF